MKIIVIVKLLEKNLQKNQKVVKVKKVQIKNHLKNS